MPSCSYQEQPHNSQLQRSSHGVEFRAPKYSVANLKFKIQHPKFASPSRHAGVAQREGGSPPCSHEIASLNHPPTQHPKFKMTRLLATARATASRLAI